MVWFQCEDCGDNLKKPKLPNHFRMCSASKLSCIDCGEVFGQKTVEGHTQCITEAEKYGPKGQAKASNGMNAKSKNDSKQKPEFDINVGLSERPPWFCSLCNTKATSKQTLLLHADGKKHRAKARAFHAVNQKPNDTAEANTCDGNKSNNTENVPEPKEQESSKAATADNGSGGETKAKEPNNKRKHDTVSDTKSELGNGEPVGSNGAQIHVTKGPKKAKHNAELDSTPNKDSGKKNIKWKKLISSALKSNADGVLKFKELRKLVMESLKEDGHTQEKNVVSEMLHEKINSSSRFVVDGKYVRLATKG
ncbi:UBP1-associated proteins 1C [Andrographis paniculata]|uniref:UBP1-associated proteins 1C n=1 Tax=Andrographis paniculata TaxID=175694 RepID=UPI0021E74F35|nr:UBP1-associated proteins 1C [Andrographis paniculata]